MLSTAYRQSSRQSEEANKIDPDNALLSRMNRRRLDAEAIRDSVIAAVGKLDTTAGAPPILLEMRPDGLQVVSSKEPENAKWRRSIYLTHRRTYPMSFLGVFDYPITGTNRSRRVPSTTPLQSLTMLNDDNDTLPKAGGGRAGTRRRFSGKDAVQIVRPGAAERERV